VPQFVRAGLKYNRWLETEGLSPLDFPPDILSDLRTIGNEISVYEATDAITPERIAIAFAAGPTKKEPDQTAYAVFDRTAVENLGIEIARTEGDTIDAAVNQLHYDLRIGSIRKLLDLAGVIATSELVAIPKKEARELMKDGFEKGRLDHTKNRTLCDRVGAVLAASHDDVGGEP
jgi:hypothetical protein